MTLVDLQKNWNRFGETDPLWSILAYPGTRGRRWDPGEFFRIGELEARAFLKRIRELVPGWTPCGGALDFGCGVGRLTQTFGRRFERCHGVDIAPAMIANAEYLAGYRSGCTFRVNDRPDLRSFRSGEFHFVYSGLVLQHMDPALSRAYIREFVRVLAPRGVLVFQQPSGPALPAHGSTAPAGPLEEFRAEVLSTTGAGAAVYFPPENSADRPLELHAGEHIAFRVRIRNTSSVTWPSGGRDDRKFEIQLGNHWLDLDGRTVTQDDGRAPLPGDVAPGEEVEVLLGARTSSEPGDFLFEVDLVQEHVTWFAGKGSPTARVPIRIVSRDRHAPQPQNGDAVEPVMEMHAIPEAEVVALLKSAGARILAVDHDDLLVPGWRSCTYYATH